MEGSGLADCLLSDARVNRENYLVRLDCGGDVFHLLHQILLVTMPTCRVDDHNVRFFFPKMVQAMLRKLDRLLLSRLAVNRDLHLRSHLLQLVQRAWPVSVRPDNPDPETAFLEESSKLDRAGSLARSLDSNEHQFLENARLNLDLRRCLSNELSHLLVEDLDHVLSPGDTGWQLLAERLVLYSLGKS